VQQALQKQADHLESSMPWSNLEVDRIPGIEKKLGKNLKIDSQNQNHRMKNENDCVIEIENDSDCSKDFCSDFRIIVSYGRRKIR
jgi:hypothetical protein